MRFENKQYIFLAGDEGTYSIQEVKTGSSENGFVEIISGESLIGKKVVIKGTYNLLMTMKNKVEE